jgi:hypothetical protein
MRSRPGNSGRWRGNSGHRRGNSGHRPGNSGHRRSRCVRCQEILDVGGADAFAAGKFWTSARPFGPRSREFRTRPPPMRSLPENSGRRRGLSVLDRGNSGRSRRRCVRGQGILDAGGAVRSPVAGILDAGAADAFAAGKILDVGAAVRSPVAGILYAAEGFESSLPGDPCPDYFAALVRVRSSVG